MSSRFLQHAPQHVHRKSNVSASSTFIFLFFSNSSLIIFSITFSPSILYKSTDFLLSVIVHYDKYVIICQRIQEVFHSCFPWLLTFILFFWPTQPIICPAKYSLHVSLTNSKYGQRPP